MQYSSAILALAAGLTTVSAHGLLTSPKPRLAGDAFKAACGTQVYYNQASDSYGNIQGEQQVAASQSDVTADCNLWLCKGFLAADNTANVQSWTAGQVVDFTFDVRAPHAGTANVSIVNTATNTIIGSPLITYADFGNNAYAIPANQTSFSITVPSDLGSTCTTAGACVVQHFWDARSIDQTYESCIDFTVGGSGDSTTPVASSSAAAPKPSSSAAPVVASSSAAPVVEATTSAPALVSSTAVPTTLQTLVKPSTTAAISATTAESSSVPSAPASDDGEYDDCE